MLRSLESVMKVGFNPAEAEEGFKRKMSATNILTLIRFNPAEAEEGFKRKIIMGEL